MSRPERLADLLPGVVADLAKQHTTTNGEAMAIGPDHGANTDDLDAMTMDELESLRRIVERRLPTEVLLEQISQEIEFRAQLSDGAA